MRNSNLTSLDSSQGGIDQTWVGSVRGNKVEIIFNSYSTKMGSSPSSFFHTIPQDLSEASDDQLESIIENAILANVSTWFDETTLEQLHKKHMELYDNSCANASEELLFDKIYPTLSNFAICLIKNEARKNNLRPIAAHEYRAFVKHHDSSSGASSRIKMWVANNTFCEAPKEDNAFLPLSTTDLLSQHSRF